MPAYLLEMESVDAAAEVGEASLLRAVRSSDGAAGDPSKPSSSCFCFLQCSERHWILELLEQHLLHLLWSPVCGLKVDTS